MNIVVGFGSTEEEQRKSVYNWIYNTIKELNKRFNWESDMVDIIHKLELKVTEYQKKIEDEYEVAKNSTHRPERYFHISYGKRIAYDHDTIFIQIGYWHINSQHPFSNDGMALLQIKETYTFCLEEIT